jgi:hypothetical protein
MTGGTGGGRNVPGAGANELGEVWNTTPPALLMLGTELATFCDPEVVLRGGCDGAPVRSLDASVEDEDIERDPWSRAAACRG